MVIDKNVHITIDVVVITAKDHTLLYSGTSLIMNSRGPSNIVHISRNFTLTVASCIGVKEPGAIKEVYIAGLLTVFILMRFYCSYEKDY